MNPTDLPDPLNSSSEHLHLDNVEALLSRLADEEIDRMIGPNGTRYDLEPISEADSLQVEPPIASRATPVQELTAQLDNFFGAMRTRDVAPPPLQVSRGDQEQEDISPREPAARNALIAPIEEPLPAYLRPLAWVSGPVLDLSPRTHMALSVLSVLCFLGSVSVLAYVLALRHHG